MRRLRSVVPTVAPIEWDRPIRIQFRDSLATPSGGEVHAASHLRNRIVMLDPALRSDRPELSRIAVHEAFHFAWLRLGNPARRSFELVLAAERKRRARGELGWSAESRKLALRATDVRNRTRAWREYVCESFCDTAAWLYAGLRQHPEFTLAPRFSRQRRAWFEHQLERGKFLT
ncbi:MAG: hypothetical protein R2729_27560 [Bryobacteraceae bacterium]